MPKASHKSSYTFRLNPSAHHEQAPAPQYHIIPSQSKEHLIPTITPSSDSFNDVLVYAPGLSLCSNSSPASYSSPAYSSSSSETEAPVRSYTSSPSEIPRSSSSRRKPAGHIPRPRNAFIIFRSEFCSRSVITEGTEHDHRHISRIIAHIWKQMSDEQKHPWYLRAEQEKLLHAHTHPNYHFNPHHRVKRPIKRKVKRNSAEDLERCRQVAELYLAGKRGNELEKEMELLRPPGSTAAGSETVSPKEARKRASPKGSRKCNTVDEERAYRSPLSASIGLGSPIEEMSANKLLSAPHVLPPHRSDLAEIQFIHEVFPGQTVLTQSMVPDDSVGAPLQVPAPTQPTPYFDLPTLPTINNLAYMDQTISFFTASAPADFHGLAPHGFVQQSPQRDLEVPYFGCNYGLDHSVSNSDRLMNDSLFAPAFSSTAQIYPRVGSLVDSSSGSMDWQSAFYYAAQHQ